MPKVVLVTGVSRYLGGRMARILTEDPNIDRVVGVDVVPPRMDIGGAEFVRADIRNPIIAKVINAAEVDTVVHMGVIATPVQAGGRMSMKEINVGPKDPAMFTEEMEPKHTPGSGWAKDSVEVESYVRGFARRRPDVSVTTLRFANFLGPRVETPMSSYFELPVIPTLLGHDARLQFIHEDDGLEALRQATIDEHPGMFNVAGDGIILLTQAARRAGRPTISLPASSAGLVGAIIRRLGLADFSPEQVRFLTYGRGVDTTRMRTVFGFTPQHTTPETFDAFVRSRRLNRMLPPERVEAVEEQLVSLLTGRGVVNG